MVQKNSYNKYPIIDCVLITKLFQGTNQGVLSHKIIKPSVILNCIFNPELTLTNVKNN